MTHASSENFRSHGIADHIIGELDRALNNIFCRQRSSRAYPAATVAEHATAAPLPADQKQLAAGLMRVNHAGEMAAQALYQGQSLTARDPKLAEKLRQASIEESDHLNWCRNRLDELDARPSVFDPLWYAGSFAIGMAAGIAGDRWNLGFLAETEHQVVRHLDSHLERLPQSDNRSRAIIEQMKIDEQGHAELAENLGAANLPQPILSWMKVTAKIMTTLAEKI
ncbi:MAG TPA: 2-polyprenyl-3-methyl-6-methoxy-1,4-benzoquinone monooxygenase [Mariprofundaceae bacterium]|nr:2-polyprenyl-3-methyl-6-methoxy-1,4-benzoquinone monooxygenase [Mariprofundaceae bacterium]